MTPREFQSAIKVLAKKISPVAEIYVGFHSDPIDLRADVLFGVLYLDRGLGRTWAVSENAEDFEGLLAAIEKKGASHAAETIRKMALRIIAVTAEQGACTDAALRGDVFSVEDTVRYGAEACADANTIAGKGPFEIVTMGGANGAPADYESARP